ncbi:hypothetical protein Syun_028482 [Stephania yunnanensis]|uniref:Uncharacterized protein n=1 Tax=Stephania yunnanensis TaxID=152371 RepID=A0AAP0HR60_9MAGN
MTTFTANTAVTTGYRQRCHHHPLPPATILPFFPFLWHGGVGRLPATLFPTFSAILFPSGEKMVGSGRERVKGRQLRERPDQAYKTAAAVIDGYSSKMGGKSFHIMERNGRQRCVR